MSLNDLIASDLSRLVSSGDFSEEVVCRVDGDEGDTKTFHVVFLNHDESRQTEAGIIVRHVGTLHVLATDHTPTVKDVWVVRSQVWNVVEVPKELHGEYLVNIVRAESSLRYPQQGRSFI